jgi:iron complex outermembrane receptor protein
MISNSEVARAVRLALVATATIGASLTAHAQDQETEDTVTVTGTRITVPGVVSSSPIYSVGAEEIQFLQQPEVERVLRLLPITAPSDGSNANNGTEGAATVNLRGLGAQRNLILINGKRATPYNFDGQVDTATIPTALIERIDIVTGGASAVYGSDAISGALNFILKENFEGVEINTDFTRTAEDDGQVRSASLTLGTNVADGSGNVVLNIHFTDREGVQLGARPLGQVGIETASGAGYAEFLAGQGPIPAPAGCGGPGSVASGGSTTTLPTRVAIAGGPGLGQFRDDGTLGDNCSVFNFNPFNYYQTPMEKFGGMVLGRFQINDHVEPYARFAYNSVKVRAQVAASGVFGDPYWTPLSNPLISNQARQAIIDAANAGVTAGTVVTDGDFPNWRDINNNGVVDAEDELNISYRRRTVEFGERSTTYEGKSFQFVVGTEGTLLGDWRYDASFQYGESDRSEVSAGYTNVENIGHAINSIDGVTCRSGGTACVPINLFGGFGSITPEMAAFSSASAIEQQNYEQQIASVTVNGPVNAVHLPSAVNPLAVSFGLEYREEIAETIPDECLKLAPASCLGGAGGNILPIVGSFDVKEVFAEAILPLANDRTGLQALDLELGYRYSDYDITGSNDTYKYGLNWRPVNSLMVRAMRQRATRAPNIGELFAPIKGDLDNADFDPCSLGNPNPIDATLRARCIATGMTDAQVGTVEDIVVGQINTFTGTDPTARPKPELADTTTIGFVWTPEIGPLRRPVLAVDYYDIDIDNVIAKYAPQQVLDSCYVLGDMDNCAKIVRIGGTLTLPGSGVQTLTTNLTNLHAEGLEISFTFGLDAGKYGQFEFAGHVNKYLTYKFQTSDILPVLDCKGRFGAACGSSPGEPGPLPAVRWTQRTTWSFLDKFEVTALWRHLGSVSVEEGAWEDTFPAFRKIDSFDYLDLYGSWKILDNVKVSLGIVNLFDEDPPIVGNEAADTRSNSGNTFPSHYDTLGRIYSIGFRANF